MASDRLKHWTPTAPSPSLETIFSATVVRDGSIVTIHDLPTTAHGATATNQPLDAGKTDLSFPPARQPSLPLRRYTRRVGGGSSRPVFIHDVTPRVFQGVWLLVLLLHTVCAVFLALAGSVYFYLLGTTLFGYLTLYGISVDAIYLPPIGIGYFTMCGIHAYSVTTIVFHSMQSKRSVFTSSQFPTRTVTTPVMRIRRMSMTAFSSVEFRTQSVLERLPSPFVRACYRTWNGLVKTYNAAQMKNECYYSVYVSRQIIQSLLHVYQMYLASVFLPRRGINTAWVVLFATNCLAIPLLSSVFRKRRPRTRLICLSINLVLDVAALVVIPSIVALPYYYEFDVSLSNFPETKWYQDAWMIRSINEFRMLLVVTPLDFVTKLGIAYNISRGLRIIPMMLKKVDPADLIVAPQDEADPHASGLMVTDGTRPAQLSPVNSDQSHSSIQKMIAVNESGRCGPHVIGSMILLLLGGAVVGAHVQAHAKASVQDCALPIEAWFTTKPTCSFLDYRCVEADQTGSLPELRAFIGEHQANTISYVSIRHCAHVEIPPELSRLNELIGFKVYNSTIATWGHDAELTHTHTPNVRFVFLIDVRMAEFPRGLMSRDFPRRLCDFEICQTNLTHLPDELDTFWPPHMTLVLERFPFAEFPAVVARLLPSSLSLASSHITSLPAQIFNNNALYYIVLNDNPIAELPANVTLGVKIYWLSLHATAVAALPVVYEAIQVDACDTPLCDALTEASVAPSGNLNCDEKLTQEALTTYPIDLEQELNGV